MWSGSTPVLKNLRKRSLQNDTAMIHVHFVNPLVFQVVDLHQGSKDKEFWWFSRHVLLERFLVRSVFFNHVVFKGDGYRYASMDLNTRHKRSWTIHSFSAFLSTSVQIVLHQPCHKSCTFWANSAFLGWEWFFYNWAWLIYTGSAK